MAVDPKGAWPWPRWPRACSLPPADRRSGSSARDHAAAHHGGPHDDHHHDHHAAVTAGGVESRPLGHEPRGAAEGVPGPGPAAGAADRLRAAVPGPGRRWDPRLRGRRADLPRPLRLPGRAARPRPAHRPQARVFRLRRRREGRHHGAPGSAPERTSTQTNVRTEVATWRLPEGTITLTCIENVGLGFRSLALDHAPPGATSP